MSTEPSYVESLEKMLTRAQASEFELQDQLDKRLEGWKQDQEIMGLYISDLRDMRRRAEAWKAAAEHMAKSVDSYRYEGYVQWCDKLTELLRVARELEKK